LSAIVENIGDLVGEAQVMLHIDRGGREADHLAGANSLLTSGCFQDCGVAG
jgi:hypothetical protein